MSIKTSIKTSVVTVQMGGKRQRSVRKRQRMANVSWANGAAVTGYEPQVWRLQEKALCTFDLPQKIRPHTTCVGLRWVLLDKRSNV